MKREGRKEQCIYKQAKASESMLKGKTQNINQKRNTGILQIYCNHSMDNDYASYTKTLQNSTMTRSRESYAIKEARYSLVIWVQTKNLASN